ncbi:AraC family transcriptional regulator [Vallitalea guaymasensis]|uniref:AraC family transcriptional regulator n=1 Tax=Vallitalea guaymasensis TaxID=1185412 RepID=UPI00272BDA47|nr:AraC family transcriptional regulator [Vallitalea guaymasensis]
MFISNVRLRKYFRYIFLSITCSFIIIINLFSFSIINFFQGKAIENEYTTNLKVLYQIKYNVEHMDNMIKKLCLSTYTTPYIRYMMYEEDQDYGELLKLTNRLRDTIQNTNDFIHSIFIYNGTNKQFFSTFQGLEFKDEYLNNMINNPNQCPPKLTPIYRNIKLINEDDKEINIDDVFTYILYDNYDEEKGIDGSIIFNIKAEWLFDNIKMINSLNDYSDEGIYILNDQNEIINLDNNSSLKPEYESDIKKDVVNNMNGDIGYFTSKISNEKFLVSYMKIEEVDWTIINVKPHKQLFKYITKMKLGILLITSLFLFITIILSIIITSKIYKPVGSLVSQLKNEDKEINNNDEIALLQNTYLYYSRELKRLNTENNKKDAIYRNYFLRKLLINSSAVTKNELREAKEEKSINLSFDNKFVLCILNIDNQIEFQHKSKEDKELYSFAIMNITTEIISDLHKNTAIDMRQGNIAIIVSNIKGENYDKDLIDKLTIAQNKFIKYFNMSFSISVSTICNDIHMLEKYYKEAVENMKYKYIFGNKTIITPEMVKMNRNNPNYSYSNDLEKKLLEAINSGIKRDINEVLIKIYKEISELHHDNITVSILKLTTTIRETYTQINLLRFEPVDIDIENLVLRASQIEYLDEYKTFIQSLIESFSIKPNEGNEKKQVILVETVKDIIHGNYSDKGLCLSQIAEILKVSQGYLGNVFKSYMKISIGAYINNVRLEKAAELLKNSNMSINEILEYIGIENKTYFYTLFKKKYGVTPKQYSLKAAVSPYL